MEKSKQIGRVMLDFSAYTGSDKYSDGPVEDEILAAVREGRSEELLRRDNRWPIFYHLSPLRENLLNWLPLQKEARVLEIGSGCGSVTGVLLRHAAEVHCVEISPRRAEIAAYRHQKSDNLTIHVGNLNDIEGLGQFDYVTLIGVLEYAASFTHTARPYHDFIASCRRFLKPGGTLIIAIENRLGLKYFGGAAEDHSGIRFDGIMDYPTTRGVRTFARKELGDLLSECGLSDMKWYYPWPDYKIPHDIYSDEGLPVYADIAFSLYPTFDHDRLLLFDEKRATCSLIRAGLFAELANSFLVLASDAGDNDQLELPIKVHNPECRRPEYDIRTELFGSDHAVYKKAVTAAARPHLARMLENEQILVGIYGREHVARSWRIDEDTIATEYLSSQSLNDLAIQAWRENGVEGTAAVIDFFCRNLVRGKMNSSGAVPDIASAGRRFNIDLSLQNIAIRDGNFVIYDYEWLASNMSAKYCFLRSINAAYNTWPHEMQQEISLNKIAHAAGITDEQISQYSKNEKRFTDMLLDWYPYKQYARKMIQL